MNAFGRLEAAKQAAVAVYEFCKYCKIPVLIYGDTADRSPREKCHCIPTLTGKNRN